MPNKTTDLWKKARTAYSSSQLVEAQIFCLEILEIDSLHANALQLQGLIAFAKNHYDEAIKLLKEALEINPESSEFNANIGSIYAKNQERNLAIYHFEKSLALNPRVNNSYKNLGHLYVNSEDFDKAAEIYIEALKNNPDELYFLTKLGATWAQLEQWQKATNILSKAIAIDPFNLNALNNLAIASTKLEQHSQADDILNHILSVSPHNISALKNKAQNAFSERNWSTAEDCFRLVEKYDGLNSEHIRNIGQTLFKRDQFLLAILYLEKAIELDSKNKDALSTLSHIFHKLGDTEQASDLLGKALKLDKQNANSRFDLSIRQLLRGDFKRGWKSYDSRLETREVRGRTYDKPVWDGSNPAGCRIFVYAEQGLGDNIQFVRYLKELDQLGAHVIYECPAPVFDLYRDKLKNIQVIKTGDQLPDFDAYIALLSLPQHFKTGEQYIPDINPVLKPEKEYIRKWQNRCESNSRLKIGIVWAGNPKHSNDERRSIRLLSLANIFQSPGIEFYSLQKDIPDRDQKTFDELDCIHNLALEFENFQDTVAVISMLDLVISVDTSVAHLAASMKVPVWILLPQSPDWRWLKDRTDSPWYPTATLYRQIIAGNWNDPVSKIKNDLNREIIKKLGQSGAALQQSSKNYKAALTLYKRKEYEDAIITSKSHLTGEISDHDYLHIAGLCAFELNRLEEAENFLKEAVGIWKFDPESLRNLGSILAKADKKVEAEQALLKSLEIDPANVNSLEHLGRIYYSSGKNRKTLDHYLTGLPYLENDAKWLSRLAVSLSVWGRFLEAEFLLDRARKLDPDNNAVNSNLGLILFKNNKLLEAKRIATDQLEIENVNTHAELQLGLINLLQGNFKQGWKYFSRRFSKNHVSTFNFKEPLWDGQNIEGKTLLISYEQGIGDTFQFIRFINAAREKCGSVIIISQKAVQKLLQRNFPDVTVVSKASKQLSFDYHCPMMDLPRLLKLEEKDYSISEPYLTVNQVFADKWEGKLAEFSDKKIGVVWKGNPKHKNDHNRSMNLKSLIQIFSSVEAHFFCLQPDISDEDKKYTEMLPSVIDLGVELKDFEDTAAVISKLDLVLTVDTSVAHLAGALGIPTWIMVPWCQDWRWQLDRTDSIWYPTVRLFRQTNSGNWAAVLDNIMKALTEDLLLPRRREPLRPLLDEKKLLNKAYELQKSEKSVSAILSLSRLLKQTPEHAEARHLLGITFYSNGDTEEALVHIKKATEIAPDVAEYWSNLGSMQALLKCFDDAESSLTRALAIDSNYFPAIENLLNLAIDKKSDKIVASYLLNFQNWPEENQKFNTQAVDILMRQSKHREVIIPLSILAKKSKENTKFKIMLADLYVKTEEFDKAEPIYSEILEFNPNNIQANSNLALILARKNDLVGAEKYLNKALALDGESPEILINLSSVCQKLGRTLQAETYLLKALDLNTDFGKASFNLGLLMKNQGNFKTARSYFNSATKDKTIQIRARFQLTLLNLLEGRMKEGWKDYILRFKLGVGLQLRKHNLPTWSGGNLAGKSILLQLEQGYGDAIQFVRYVRNLKNLGATVYLETPPPMQKLFKSMPEIDYVISQNKAVENLDYVFFLMNLPSVFTNSISQIPGDTPYLKVINEEKILFEKLVTDKAGIKAGLVWSGNPSHTNDHNRSMDLPIIEAILKTPDIHFYCLQKEFRDGDEGIFDRFDNLENMSSHLKDFSDTAALIDNLDLVITVDTSVAHLAGAMGKPVWIMLPFVPDWRWLLDREDSPWYPTARLFRQPALDDWASVIKQVKHALTELAGSKS